MSSPGTRRRMFLTPRSRDMLVILACILAHALYLLMAYSRYGYFSFPLDDAWIYQVYARNLATSGQWAFVPGVPSTGSTSILWTLLIAPAYLLHVAPVWWTHLLGLLSLVMTSLGAARLFDEDSLATSLAVGLAVALEWHLVWAAASGMETTLFSAMLLWFWIWLSRRDPARLGHSPQDGLMLGLWGGALMLARPEGVLAFGVAWLYVLLCRGNLASRLRWGFMSAVGFMVFLGPFLALNISISGTLWPNTFYAKQMEYSSLWDKPYLVRFAEQVIVSFAGAQVVLVPALLAELWGRFRNRPERWVTLLPWAWALAHWALYAARLPQTYQHGRYAIPIIPLAVIYGTRGLMWIARPRARQMSIRLASLVWLMAAGLLFPLFLGVSGAPAYAKDVAYIEVEMVSTARWIAARTATGDVIAAHDIGALGYFAPRQLVDLAGLISPDVIPFMNNGQHLADYIIDRETDYLVVFPGWSLAYHRLTSDPRVCPVWSASEAEGYIRFSDLLGSMTVYQVSHEGNCPAIGWRAEPAARYLESK